MRTRAYRAAAALTGVTLVLTGCGGDQSTLNPKSEQSRHIANLWWGMLVAAFVVFLGAIALLLIGWIRRSPGLPFFGEREGITNGMVVAFGAVIPVIALVALFIIANIGVVKTTAAPAVGSTQMTIHVIGHQWFWEVRYPGTAAVTANEIHIPARTPVNLVARTADVIHSFWVPRLNRKIDMIPGRTNRIELDAPQTGVYPGQCSEFCGLEHADMGLEVVVQTPAAFRAWLADQARPARAPTTPQELQGRQVFLTASCADCHTIRGTPAVGRAGPDLTHVGSRRTIAALTLPNTPSSLFDWITNPQLYKPGARMPGFASLPASTRRALVAYLESLR